jgi:transcriptional regulator with GAF, ATPase, and Fis domain
VFHAVNLSALSPTLIESELFGHRRGAFTGAVGDRIGWLESCPRLGTVFLDEVGDVEPAIQLKVLRVLESRTFQRIGDTKDRLFHGKIIAATNRDLAEDRRAGRFREDLYYRICSDVIRTPSLHERVAACPAELRHMVLFLARRLVGDEGERLADDVLALIDSHIGHAYTWPGNVRELEQCVRNVLVRREYCPVSPPAADGGAELATELMSGTLTADEVLTRYCRIVYDQCGSYQEAARRLGLDRRTVKARVVGARA